MTVATASAVHDRLEQLLVERALATVEGLAGNRLYMDGLEAEIAATRAAYAGTAVTEIATLRGELSGRPQG